VTAKNSDAKKTKADLHERQSAPFFDKSQKSSEPALPPCSN